MKNIILSKINFFFLFWTTTLYSSTPILKDISEFIPDIELEIKYSQTDNFLNQKVSGYHASRCLLTLEAIKALQKIQAELRKKSLGLKIFDCYRPQKAVDFFKKWMVDGKDSEKIGNFYLSHNSKSELIAKGFVAERSSHTKGSTLDLTIVNLKLVKQNLQKSENCYNPSTANWGNEIDMGTIAGCFHIDSYTKSKAISKAAQENRKLLLNIMKKHGFKNYSKEWWHYTLQDEPYSQTYFDFDLEKKYENTEIQLVERIFNQTINAGKKFPSLYSIILFNQKTILFENYYNSFKPAQMANIKSVSKSLLSILVGKAIEQGKLELTSEIGKVQLQYLLSMSSGFEPTSGKNYASWVQSKNWVQYILEKPLKYQPGKSFEYSTGNSHLVSYLLAEKTNESVEDYAKKYLFSPLDIETFRWDKDPQGINFGGNNLFMKARGLAKIGVMVLNDGTYNQNKIINEDWINKSTSKHAAPPAEFIEFKTLGYGYFWWILDIKGKMNCALGYGGQFLCYSPEKKLGFLIISNWNTLNPRPYYKELIPYLNNLLEGN